ncbi:MAG: AAA family ATPase [Clostridiales bacterium]|nr:MAG: AAA family ATPase [Clostridiales bacterium]
MTKCQINIKEKYSATVAQGTSLAQIAQDVEHLSDTPIVALKVNNHLRELHRTIEQPQNEIEIINYSHPDGVRIVQRGLSFILIRAVKELFGEASVDIQHSLSKGLFCLVKKKTPLTADEVDQIEAKMCDLIAQDEPFEKMTISLDEAHQIFQKQGMYSKRKLLKYRNNNVINVYKYGWLYNYFYGYMAPSAGLLTTFELTFFDGGVILRTPTPYSKGLVPPFEAQPKISHVHRESEKWGDILKVGYLYNINELIQSGQITEQILINEALHEKKIAEIADRITREKRRIVLIAGPSSSGKTTFATRLKIQLRVNGLRPINMGTDDYFVEREYTPKDEFGKPDFESIDAVDRKLFNQNLSDLLAGKEVELPTFNFQKGAREYHGEKLQIADDQLIIIEGIHGLNPLLTEAIDDNDKFKIYISCLTQLNIDNHNRIPTTDSRLIRRIIRDNKYRGHSAEKTIAMWASVRRGEERNIFPYQESADVMFNSALAYELPVLKKHIEPLLLNISKQAPEYPEVKRILKFLSYVLTVPSDQVIPNTSIIKEFIGGSVFSE